MLTKSLTKMLAAPTSIALMLALAIAPAAWAQQSAAEPLPVARLIIKLQSPGDEAVLMRQIRQKLPRPERLMYLREMSTDTHVLSVVAPATAESVPGLIAELRATGLFEYVELDRMMTIHSSRQSPKTSQ